MNSPYLNAPGEVHFHTVVTTSQINRECVTDQLICCFEGGSGHWINRVRLWINGAIVELPLQKPGDDPWYSKPEQFDDHDWAMKLWFDDENKVVTKDMLKNGFSLLAEKHPKSLARMMDPGASDADDANTWLQLATFGEVIYE